MVLGADEKQIAPMPARSPTRPPDSVSSRDWRGGDAVGNDRILTRHLTVPHSGAPQRRRLRIDRRKRLADAPHCSVPAHFAACCGQISDLAYGTCWHLPVATRRQPTVRICRELQANFYRVCSSRRRNSRRQGALGAPEFGSLITQRAPQVMARPPIVGEHQREPSGVRVRHCYALSWN